MKTLGIIVEYNPMHNGHLYHLTEAKNRTGASRTVAVMSGPFLQRGEPAIVDKWARTEMALAMGVDLVLELPVAYAVQAADWFAYGAVALLESTGIVDCLCFGSEAGDLSPLQALATALTAEPDALKSGIAERLAAGWSYPAAYADAACALAAEWPDHAELSGILQQPNNTLGLHYVMALQRLGSAIVPCTITRSGSGYHDAVAREGEAIASATAIRRLLLSGGPNAAAPYVPGAVLDILRREWAAGRGPQQWDSFSIPLLHGLITRSPQQLAELHEVNEGLEHRLLNGLHRLDSPSVESLLSALKTKRYTRTRLQRMLTHILLNHSKVQLAPTELAAGPHYLRILGFNQTGRAMLKEMKQRASLPLLVQASSQSLPQLELDLQASAIYSAAMREPEITRMYADYLRPPVIS